jgi:hypothetical protein
VPLGHPGPGQGILVAMTNSRTRPEPVPAGPRPRPSDERAQLAASGRTTRRVAVAALVLALVGVGIAAARFVLPGAEACQSAAWDVEPDTADLPEGWSLGASQFDLNRQQVTLLGPVPADEAAQRAVVYTTVTCFPSGASEAVGRSEQASRDAQQTVIVRDDLGNGGFSASDESGATFTQFRAGDIVVYLAASADASPTEVDALASAFDKALGGDGGAIAVGSLPPASADGSAGTASADPSAGTGSAEPSDAPAAPELEARLPTEVAGIQLTVDSAIGTDVLGEDASSRAITAALRAAGKSPEDVRLAQAYDETGAADLSILAVEVEGMPEDTLQGIMLDSWLAASGAGVTKTTQMISGREVTVVDYGDDGAKDYVVTDDGAVIIITTAGAEVATAAIAALP